MAATSYAFGAFVLDPHARRLTRGGDPVALPDRHLDVLIHLVSQAGVVLSKDALVSAAWNDVAVTDNSLEQAVSSLRRALGAVEGGPCIETVPRRGYRFAAAVTRLAARESDAALDALLDPHRAWLEGRAALQTLERRQIERAHAAFEDVLRRTPDQPQAHIGMANACALLCETTRADLHPQAEALATAAGHAREACRLDPQSGEAWATLGFVLDRSGRHEDAVAALRRAVLLEPDNWRHHLRLSYASWGEDRVRAARRTLALLPGFALAHWMIATVHVARNVLAQAAAELEAGVAAQARQGEHAPFSAVGLHWLLGLIHLAHDDHGRALDALERELACESTGHLYARESCANTWYAIGALHLRLHRFADARQAFRHALDRVAAHPQARLALGALGQTGGTVPIQAEMSPAAPGRLGGVDAAMSRAVAVVLQGDTAGAARLVDRALDAAPPGSAGWLLPVEPLLRVDAAPDLWGPALGRLRARAV